MKKILAFTALLALSACGSPYVKDGDLTTKLTSMGYSKVLIRPGKLNCGQFGKGKHFLGTRKDGMKVIGQICYKKGKGDVQYNVAINQELGKGGGPVTTESKTDSKGTLNVPNPWKK